MWTKSSIFQQLTNNPDTLEYFLETSEDNYDNYENTVLTVLRSVQAKTELIMLMLLAYGFFSLKEDFAAAQREKKQAELN